jgi:hypothetical protein
MQTICRKDLQFKTVSDPGVEDLEGIYPEAANNLAHQEGGGGRGERAEPAGTAEGGAFVVVEHGHGGSAFSGNTPG